MTTEVFPISIPLDTITRHAGTVRSAAPLTVESTPAQWAYAISVRLALDEHAHSRLQFPAQVTVMVTVESGQLGCLLVDDDWTTLLGSVPRTVTNGRQSVVLTWERGEGIANLVFRNNAAGGHSCVFTVESVQLAPALAQVTTDGLRVQDYLTNLLTQAEGFLLHGTARSLGTNFEFVTGPGTWSYAVSLPIVIPPLPDPSLDPLIVVEIHVLEGRVGVGVLDETMQQFVSSEIDAAVSERPVTIRLTPNAVTARVHVMVRNTASGGSPSRFRLLGATLEFKARDRRLLAPLAPPEIELKVHAAPALHGTFDLLISHSSRGWNADQCDRGYLERRYASPDRLTNLPAFDSLPPNAAPYHGLLSVFRLRLSVDGVAGDVLRHYVSPEKVVHAAVTGGEIVVCFDSGLAVFARRQDADFPDVVPESAERVVDPWFGGLHTVIMADGRTCLVSSAGADAILWLDVASRRIVRRWRLPAPRYGINYALNETTWLSEHYISNDLQLGHLNCAAPDGEGGAYFSVLGQGDVARVDPSGNCELLVSGFVGCHGVRYDPDERLLYFSDSCTGRLIRVDGPGRTSVLFDAGSRWLHDSVHLGKGVFLLTLGDRNRLVLADTRAGRLLAEWDFSATEGTVQFINLVPHRTNASRGASPRLCRPTDFK